RSSRTSLPSTSESTLRARAKEPRQRRPRNHRAFSMKQGTVKLVGLALGVAGIVGLPARWARADELDEYAAKLIDMEQRATSMLAEFRGTAPQSPDLADRRVLDAQ